MKFGIEKLLSILMVSNVANAINLNMDLITPADGVRKITSVCAFDGYYDLRMKKCSKK